MESSVNAQYPAESAPTSPAEKGGWITFPFILATMIGISLSSGLFLSNLEVYLIQEFNIERISAAKIFNVVNGSMGVFPLAAAVISDSFLRCYTVIWISSLISSLGIILLVLTAAIGKLRPPPCENGSNVPCTSPTAIQLAILYLSLALSTLGVACTSFTVVPMGAYQFDKPEHQGIVFNWFTFVTYICALISSIGIVYVQNNVSWAWGFGIGFVASTIGLVAFVAGARFYRQLKPQGSPFSGLARVVVASIRKRSIMQSQNPQDYCQDPGNQTPTLPTKFFRFLNRAALRTEGDTAELNGSVRKSWQLCTVTEVEDLKTLIKMLPLWSTAFIVYIPVIIQLSMIILQILAMDRHLGHNFQIPAGSVTVFIFLSTCITVSFTDQCLFPLWNKFARHPITPLQRVGIGHVLDVLGMAASALVEMKRLKIARLHYLQDQDNAVVPMSVFWLVPPMALVGMGVAFHFPAQIAFYYQEFPNNLKSTSTGILALAVGVAYYVGNALIDVVRRSTAWLPENINQGRLDNVYWLVTIIGGINFLYFLLCSSLYNYKNVENATDDVSVNEE